MSKQKHQIIDSVESLETAIKKLRDTQKIFSNYTQDEVDKIFLATATAACKARYISQNWQYRKQVWG